jgi:hypothetical protein
MLHLHLLLLLLLLLLLPPQAYDKKSYTSRFDSGAGFGCFRGLLELFVRYPLEFFSLPKASFILSQGFFIAFVATYMWLMACAGSSAELGWLHSQLTWEEILVGSYLSGFILREFKELSLLHLEDIHLVEDLEEMLQQVCRVS